jgi:membrane protease YdiL (CAAX protease family)
MPADDAHLMLKAGAAVAAAAVPVAAAAAVVLRRGGGPVCPRWVPPAFVWPGLAVLGFLFGGHLAYQPVVAALDALGFYRAVYPNGVPTPDGLTPNEAAQVASQLRFMWASLGLVPAALLIAAAVRAVGFHAPPRVSGRLLLRSVALGTGVWVTVGTTAYTLNLIIQTLFQRYNIPVTEHTLSKLGPAGDGAGGWLFVLSACVAVPAWEEFLFRGLLVDWAGGRWYRPWVLVFAAGWWVATTAGAAGPLGFVAVLAAGLYLIQRVGPRVRHRFPKRTVGSIWGSSALFAAAHSTVWPSPIPLFVLALGLGYVTARTRSWLPAAVAHGLFNLVSTLFVFAR